MKELTEWDFKQATMECKFSQKHILEIVTEPNRSKILKSLKCVEIIKKMLTVCKASTDYDLNAVAEYVENLLGDNIK